MVGLDVRGVSGTEERECVRSLLRSEFEVAPGVSAAFAALYDDLLERDPHVTPEHSRVAILEGRVVVGGSRNFADGPGHDGGVRVSSRDFVPDLVGRQQVAP